MGTGDRREANTPRLVGIDIGSSSVKAAIFDLAGQQRAVARVRCESTGEFDPGGWWDAACTVLGQLDLEGVGAVGVCGRGGTNVLLDANGEPCAPSWDDGRAGEELRLVRRELAPGQPPQAQALLAKALWWQERHGTVATAFSAKDYVVHRLTGAVTSDPASGGGEAGAPPPLVAARSPWDLAGKALGNGPLPDNVPVAVGWHDGAAAVFGAGAAAEGTAALTLGTNAVYRVVAAALPGALRKYWDLTPGLTVTGGDILHAGLAWAWARALHPEGDPALSPPGADGVTFLPQLSGRIAPDVDRSARGAFLGLSMRTTADDLLRSVLEGTAFSLRQVRDWLVGEGLRGVRTLATGGGARHPFQAQVLADVLQQPVEVADCEEGCRGAALLGGVAAGLLDLEDARTLFPARVTYLPDPSTLPAYADAHARFLHNQRMLGQERDDG